MKLMLYLIPYDAKCPWCWCPGVSGLQPSEHHWSGLFESILIWLSPYWMRTENPLGHIHRTVSQLKVKVHLVQWLYTEKVKGKSLLTCQMQSSHRANRMWFWEWTVAGWRVIQEYHFHQNLMIHLHCLCISSYLSYKGFRPSDLKSSTARVSLWSLSFFIVYW